MTAGSIDGLAGVLIWTEAQRFPAMARFYRDTLGLAARTAKGDFVNFDWSSVRLSVATNSSCNYLDRLDSTSLHPHLPSRCSCHDFEGRNPRASSQFSHLSCL